MRSSNQPVAPHRGDALLVIDVQNDFLPGGSLAVPQGDQVIEPLNRWLSRFARAALPVFATRDWHPPDHRSFAARGGPRRTASPAAAARSLPPGCACRRTPR